MVDETQNEQQWKIRKFNSLKILEVYLPNCPKFSDFSCMGLKCFTVVLFRTLC